MLLLRALLVAPAGAVVALAGASAAPKCAASAPAVAATAPGSAVSAPVGAVDAPRGVAAPECAEATLAGAVGVPAGALNAPVGVGDAPAGAVAAPRGAVGALSGAVDERGHVVRRRVTVGCVAPFGAGAGQHVASVVTGESLAGVRRVRVVGDAVSVALARVDDRELPLSGVAAEARSHGASSDGWRRTCECGIWLGVARWELQAGCALVGAASYTNGLGMALSQSLDVPLVPRVPRPMRDGRSRKPLTRGKLAGGIETPCTATARRLQRHSKRQRGRVNAPRGR